MGAASTNKIYHVLTKVSEISISNNALLELGANPINAFSESSKEAILLSAIFPTARRTLLRLHPWNFAMTQAKLAKVNSKPIFNYTNEYALPDDFLKLWQVYQNGDYKIAKNKILTNKADCQIEYVADVVDCNSWDSFFVDLFISYLKYKMCFSIIESTSAEVDLYNIYKQNLKIAKWLNGEENILNEYGQFDSPLISVREYN